MDSRHNEGEPERYGRLTRDRVHALVAAHTPDADEAFLCGPVEMPQAVRDALLGVGMPRRPYPQRTLHRRHPAPQPAGTPGTAVHDVTIVGLGTKHVPVGPTESVLDAGLRAGLDLSYSFREGTAARAAVRLDDCDLDQADIDAGYVLMCRTRPLDDSAVIAFDHEKSPRSSRRAQDRPRD